MEAVLSDDEKFALRFDPGEEIIGELTIFAQQHGIDAGMVTGIGSSREVELGFYDLPSKEYWRKVFDEPMEVVNLTGTIAILSAEPVVHLHGSFSLPDYRVLGGHVHRLTVNTTLEVTIDTIGGELARRYDDDAGLNLLTQQ